MHLEDFPDVFVIDTDIVRFPAPETHTVDDLVPEGETELVHLGWWFCSREAPRCWGETSEETSTFVGVPEASHVGILGGHRGDEREEMAEPEDPDRTPHVGWATIGCFDYTVKQLRFDWDS